MKPAPDLKVHPMFSPRVRAEKRAAVTPKQQPPAEGSKSTVTPKAKPKGKAAAKKQAQPKTASTKGAGDHSSSSSKVRGSKKSK